MLLLGLLSLYRLSSMECFTMLTTTLIIVINAPVMTNRTKIIELVVWNLRPGTEETGVSLH